MEYLDVANWGVKIPKNATYLDGSLSAGATTVVLLHALPGELDESDTILVDRETITLGSTGDNLTYTGCTRNANSTGAVAHDSGRPVRKWPGETLASKTFTTEEFVGARMGCPDIEMSFGKVIDDVLKRIEDSTPYNLAEFEPSRVNAPGSGTLKYYGWLFADKTPDYAIAYAEILGA